MHGIILLCTFQGPWSFGKGVASFPIQEFARWPLDWWFVLALLAGLLISDGRTTILNSLQIEQRVAP